MIMLVGFYIVLFLVYFKCPKYLQLVILVANFFIPDIIPYLDEVIMVLGLLSESYNSRKNNRHI